MKTKKYFSNRNPYQMIIQVILILIISVYTPFMSSIQAREILEPESQHPRVAQLVVKLLSNIHYEKYDLNDSISVKQYRQYFSILDHNRSFFIAQDIAGFERFKYQFDDYIKAGNLDPAYYIFNIFSERVAQRVAYVKKCLETPFDFTLDESYAPDREHEPWANSIEELDEIWRKRLKYEALSLKLADKDWDGIVETLNKRYDSFQKRIDEYSSEDVFQVFINSMAESYDPHSGYMSPFTSDNFGIQMSLSFQGIGAQLTSEDDYTKVVAIIPGGPADFDKRLKPNDKIVGVGQGEDGEILDVIGMKLDDVVTKIRGEKGTVVRLEIIPADAPKGSPTKMIRLVRDKVVLKEREAKADTVDFEYNGQKAKLGIIKIPSFYADYKARAEGDEDYRGTANDVRRLLQDLKEAGVEGVVIDLRRNTGGFLLEAVELTGLFIEQGPVVQVRRSNGIVEVERDRDRSIEYDGPLAVLVDRISASASEIFAAAIQDYGRGVIVGSQTFGKGTVQNLIKLNNYMPYYKDDLGEVRVTMAKFYRIAGGSTQHMGVIPDITFPSIYNEMDIGESKELNALLYDEIKACNFDKIDEVKQYLPLLTEKSKQRTISDMEFNYLNEDIKEYRAEKDQELISLNIKVREKEDDEREAKRLARTNQRRAAEGLPPLKKGEKAEEDEKISPDPWLDETERILADYIDMTGDLYRKNKLEVMLPDDEKKIQVHDEQVKRMEPQKQN